MKYAPLALDALVVLALTALLITHAIDPTAGLSLFGALIGARAIQARAGAAGDPPTLPPGATMALGAVLWGAVSGRHL